MKFTCNRTDLVKTISIAERAVAIRNPMYILEGLYLEAKEGQVTVVSNNMDLGIECHLDAAVEEEGTAVVKASLFCDAVRKLPDRDEDVLIEKKDNIEISCGNAHFDFPTMNPDEFPRLPFVEEKDVISIPEGVLKSMLRQTLFAVAQMDSKPVLTGSYFNIVDGHIVVVGCDGYRIAIRKEEIAYDREVKFIIPGKTSKEMLSILSDSDNSVSIFVSNNYVSFRLKSCLIISRLIEGEYFDYTSVMKHKNTLVVTCETEQILGSVDRASLIVNETEKTPVILHIENDSVQINSAAISGKVNDQFNVVMSGDPIDIAFNPRYLMDAFRNCDTSKIRFTFSTSVNPAVIEPLDGDKFLYVVVPMRVR